MKTFNSDIDIDLANREKLLELINHVPASMKDGDGYRKHPTGIYATEIPYDPIRNLANIDYSEAESRGYIKLDLLNVNLYNDVTSEEHLLQLMNEPDWSLLSSRHFVEQIIHINKHYRTMKLMPEPIDSVIKMAMFLAIIRPGKKHLIGKSWDEVSKTIWLPSEEGFVFKKSHSLAYSHLVVVSMNLLAEKMKK